MKNPNSNLSFKLSSKKQSIAPTSAFAAKQIKHRILMVAKTWSLPWQRARFTMLLPVVAMVLMSFAERATETNTTVQLRVGKISWEGNTLYTDSQLTEKLGIHSGEVYSADHFEQRLWVDEDAVSSLYMDNGHLFFNAEPEEDPKEDGTVDLTIRIYEGLKAKIGKIIIKGNGTVPEKDIADRILLRHGDLFSRIKLIHSVRAIAQMDQFEKEDIFINPIPQPEQLTTGEYAVTDIEFIFKEK